MIKAISKKLIEFPLVNSLGESFSNFDFGDFVEISDSIPESISESMSLLVLVELTKKTLKILVVFFLLDVLKFQIKSKNNKKCQNN